MVQLADFARTAFHHRLSHAHLAVSDDDDFSAPSNRQYCRPMDHFSIVRSSTTILDLVENPKSKITTVRFNIF